MECPLMEPTTKHHRVGQRPGLFCQTDKDQLRDVFGQLRVAIGQTEGGRIDEVDIARYQLAEGEFAAATGVFGEQCPAFYHVYLPVKPRQNAKPNKLYRPWGVKDLPKKADNDDSMTATNGNYVYLKPWAIFFVISFAAGSVAGAIVGGVAGGILAALGGQGLI